MIPDMDNETIQGLVQAFTGNTSDVVKEIKQEYNMDTGNFKNGGTWDIRFGRIKQVALQNNLVVLTKRRGPWTFISVLNLKTGSLFVFSKENNLETVMKKFGRKAIHYFHAFVSLNSGPVDIDNQQMSLFSTLPKDYESKRLEEVQKVLGEEYPLVNEVVFVVAKELDKKIVGVEARLYNRYFNLLDTKDWSAHILEEEYGNLLIIDDDASDISNSEMVIPKIKQELKDRRNSQEKKILVQKDKKELKEEDQS